MSQLISLVWKLRIWSDTRGQDLLEYALMTAVVAVGAGAILPNLSGSISQIFSTLGGHMRSVAASS